MIGGLVARHTITRKRPVMVSDGRGGQEPDYTTTTDVDLPGWAVDAGNTVQDLTNRDGDSIEWTLRGPFTADIDRRDLVTLFGQDYQIEGAVRRQPGPSALTSHTIVQLIRWEG
ncbi:MULTISPECIES: hypothetical protein [unclassified Microbacterium]|uniref:hypothetical protein n=1 Tax=Microbacterium TaxID=33882 RepID=UPI003BA34D5C